MNRETVRAAARTATAALRSTRKRRALLTGTGLVAVPLLVAGLLAWAFGHGLVSQGSAVAAVVVDDQPVTIKGQLVPLGRQLAQTLVHGGDLRYHWVLTNDEDARRGLENGDYAAVVTIPPTFSRKATSAATTDQPLSAAQGVISVTASRDAALADVLISKDVADAATSTTSKQVVQTYLDNVYIGFTTIHGKIGEAADGAQQLANGIARATSGSRQLADGTGTLVVGLGSLADGASQAATGARAIVGGTQRLSAGTRQLAAGASELARGTGRLRSGAGQLSGGLNTLASKTADLPGQTRRLANGARQVADGNARLANQVVPVADKVIRVIDAVPDLSGSTGELKNLAAQCRNLHPTVVTVTQAPAPGASGPGNGRTTTRTRTRTRTRTTTRTTETTTSRIPNGFCASVDSALSRLSTVAHRFDATKAEIRGQVTSLRDGVVQLKDGSAQVADGAAKLAAATPVLTHRIAQAADGGRQLAAGAAAVDTGARRLETGTAQAASGASNLSAGVTRLADGVTRVASGSAEARDGARRLADGADQLVAGLTTVGRGAGQLAQRLDASRASVPSYTAAERDHLKQVAATPAYARDASGDVLRRIAASFVVVLALWIGSLATFLVTRAVPRDVLTSRDSTARLAARAVMPGVAVAAASGLVLAAGLFIVLDLGVLRTALVTCSVIIVAVAFTVLNQSLAATLDWPGRLVSLGILALSAGAGILSTTPPAVKTLAALLPTHDALAAVRAATTGGSGLTPALLQLLLWVAMGVGVTAYVTDRRRSVSRRLLRPRSLR